LFTLNLACGDALLIIANVPVLVISSFKGAWIGGVPGKKLIRKDTDLNKHGILVLTMSVPDEGLSRISETRPVH
jgi:hypothetical protein